MHIPQSLYSSMRLIFLYVDRYVFRRGWAYPESYVPYCMLRYILKGSAVFRVNGEEYLVGENEIFYIPEGCQLECHALGEEFEFISIRFTVTVQLDGSDFLAEYFHIPRVTRGADGEVLGCTRTQPPRIPESSSASGATWSSSWPGWWNGRRKPGSKRASCRRPTFRWKACAAGRTGPIPSSGTPVSRWWWTIWWPIRRSPSTRNFSAGWRI